MFVAPSQVYVDLWRHTSSLPNSFIKIAQLIFLDYHLHNFLIRTLVRESAKCPLHSCYILKITRRRHKRMHCLFLVRRLVILFSLTTVRTAAVVFKLSFNWIKFISWWWIRYCVVTNSTTKRRNSGSYLSYKSWRWLVGFHLFSRYLPWNSMTALTKLAADYVVRLTPVSLSFDQKQCTSVKRNEPASHMPICVQNWTAVQ